MLPPQGALGGDQVRVGCDAQSREAKAVEMRPPDGGIGEPRLAPFRQTADHRPGKRAAAHVGQRRRVDHVIGVPGAQQVEEVQPALARPCAEPGETVVTDLRAEPVGVPIPRPGVVDRDPGGALQAGPQHLAALGQEVRLAVDQQTQHLPLGDADADRPQLRRQPLHRDLTLVVQHQHEAAQLRTEMAADAVRKRDQQRPAIRRKPTFTPVPDHPGPQYQVLRDVGLVPLEARPGRSGQLQHPLLDAHPRRRLAAPATLAGMPGRRCGRLLHAARLEMRAWAETLQPRNLLTLLRQQLPELRHLAQQTPNQSFQLRAR